jgi:hypothetical protein
MCGDIQETRTDIADELWPVVFFDFDGTVCTSIELIITSLPARDREGAGPSVRSVKGAGVDRPTAGGVTPAARRNWSRPSRDGPPPALPSGA